jgi:HAMP domain-containing protein
MSDNKPPYLAILRLVALLALLISQVFLLVSIHQRRKALRELIEIRQRLEQGR